MTWVKLDDRTTQHPKTTNGSLEAFGLWSAGLIYCNALNNGGVIPKNQLRVVFPGVKVKTRTLNRCARELVELGRWHDRGDHWEIHGYAVEQKHALPNEVAKRREADAKRQRDHRERNANETGNDPEPDEKLTGSEREPDEKLTGNAQEPDENETATTSDSEVLGDVSRRDPRERAREPGPARPGHSQTQLPSVVVDERASAPDDDVGKLAQVIQTWPAIADVLSVPPERQAETWLSWFDPMRPERVEAAADVVNVIGASVPAGEDPGRTLQRITEKMRWRAKDVNSGRWKRKAAELEQRTAADDPNAQRDARRRREAEERQRQAETEAQAASREDAARAAREAMAAIGNGGLQAAGTKSEARGRLRSVS